MTNNSIKIAFERFWQHVVAKIENQVDQSQLDAYETKADASGKLTEAKTYADSAAASVKSDLLNGAGAAYDTLKELGDLIDDNTDAIGALETVAAGKANQAEVTAIANLVGDTAVATQISTAISPLSTQIANKANASHGNHVPNVESANNTRFLRNDNTWQAVTPANIGAAPAYSYGTGDLTAGSSSLATGQLYFVYE